MESTGSREIYANPWMRLREDSILRPDGSDGIYGVVDKPDYALVIPLDAALLEEDPAIDLSESPERMEVATRVTEN